MPTGRCAKALALSHPDHIFKSSLCHAFSPQVAVQAQQLEYFQVCCLGAVCGHRHSHTLITSSSPHSAMPFAAGSSAGSAASTAARFAPWALCEDTGGSCRAPAMANGIFGLRPTLGCYNYSDALVLATFTRDTVGRCLCLCSVQGHPLSCHNFCKLFPPSCSI